MDADISNWIMFLSSCGGIIQLNDVVLTEPLTYNYLEVFLGSVKEELSFRYLLVSAVLHYS